jgi:hypothetical protein
MNEELSNQYQEAVDRMVKKQEEYWNSLTKEQQLDAFCCVSRRIFEGEIKNKGSYRHVLYSVFGFGPEAYMLAQEAGYLAIHNSIFTAEYESLMLHAFCKKYNIEDAENKVTNFLI